MKKVIIAALLFATTAFAKQLVVDNQTTYPEKNQKIAIQWANSAREVDESNKSLIDGSKFNPKSLQAINKRGKIDLTIPKDAAYFRIIVWRESENSPAFLTNWIDIDPDTTYTLKPEYLIPAPLMSGMGC